MPEGAGFRLGSSSWGNVMKRIVLCLDGTWNNSRVASTLTNVHKLHQVVAPADANGVRQISNYVEGIVSADGESLQFVKGGIGFGVDDRIRKAYDQLVADYELGDEIYLVGFSRGAFEARSLGGFITHVGVAKSDAPSFFDKAWSLYRAREKSGDQAALAELRATAHYPVRIKCVGVWDTVGNLGNPFTSGGMIGRRYAFHDMRLSDNIDVGLHALSIDEVRGPFRPTLWTLPKRQALPANQHIEQVWFAGTHADVGGGHRETSLSDIALWWMAERLQANTGLALDMHKLEHLTRPDPLGAQHSVTQGWIFRWSALVPFIRLVKQAAAAISPFRRSMIGNWRTSKLPRSVEAVNESIHPSVLERFGERVIELRQGRSNTVTYRPRNLAAAIPEWRAKEAKPKAGERHVKIFTVHGTFAHETDWDNWDPHDDAKKEQRAFINRLAGHLKEKGILLKDVDHTEYNWSGGNSHDERRVAAIGLKKLIQEKLSEAYEKHGPDHYDKVFIVAHSHGGTISRMAMNLWDKDEDYYDPIKTSANDELKLDDQCPTCMRTRNGHVGRNSVRRPDGVITFGSPFVTFEQRWGGMLVATIGVWVYRILALLPLLGLLYLSIWGGGTETRDGQDIAQSPILWTALVLAFPLVLYWLLGVHLLQRLRALAERWLGTGDSLLYVSTILQGLKYLLLAGVAVYYLVWATGSWNYAVKILPILKPIGSYFWYLAPLVLLWLLIVTLPGRFRRWMRDKVIALREKLPKKYDPAEDRAVSYLSYHTPGDEAGLHLRIFGTLTWLVQTLGLSAAIVLASGIFLTIVIGIEAFNHWAFNGSLLSKLGLSAWQTGQPALQDRFIQVMDWLTYFPAMVWSKLGVTSILNIGSLPDPRNAAWWVPVALLAAITLIFLLLMPLVLFLLAIAYVVSMRLRRSGLVFGSESFAWTMANRIGVKRRANDNTLLRVMFISPEAWRRQEIAHSYYYKSDRIIEDVAGYMADWSRHTPSRFLSIGGWVADTARWAVVALFVFSIFAVSVPIANSFANKSKPAGEATPAPAPESKPEPKLIEEELQVCARHTVRVVVPSDAPGDVIDAAARKLWEADVTAKLGTDWAKWKGSDWSSLDGTGDTGDTRKVEASFCKPRPIDCQQTPHGAEVVFELSSTLDDSLTSGVTSSVVSTLRQRWQAEALGKYGSDWSDIPFNFKTLRDRRPVEDGCKGQDAGGGRTRYECKVATTACKGPLVPAQQPAPVTGGGSRGSR
jgi:hypothetical protein